MLRFAEKRFREAGLHFGHGTDNARDEAAWLVASSFHIPFDNLSQRLAKPLDEASVARTRALVQARVDTRKPLAYLLNEAWFAGLKFYVDERVLVPRSIIGELIFGRFSP